jgi:predicted RNase H-like HicB family nuclease
VKFRATIEPDEDGVFVAECPALPDCISQGKTRDEATMNIRGEPTPESVTASIVEVSV